MREIKFRVYDQKLGKYIDNVFMKMDNQRKNVYIGWSAIENDISCSDVNEKIVFEQYTGLKDKNRNNAEVYEGDIYKWCGIITAITVDDYHGFRFMFGKDQLVRAFIENGKYIGNIHEEK